MIIMGPFFPSGFGDLLKFVKPAPIDEEVSKKQKKQAAASTEGTKKK